ncbi:hypothetical protein HPB48_003929 [Haemaphysalis longicornis]|uniref:CCHC-type domain-containing protein n=1 Tax=Haemaphysalis longicornis TaxID=44386 RepID=A0A9J6FEM8_HAELO|nr:hypothetical protein HPB48_003929 [Haemaphysalis longicornis]
MPAAKTAAAATPEDNQAAMEVIPADELDEYVDRDSGRTTVKVRGVSTDENSSSPSSEDHAGWIVATRRGRKIEKDSTTGDATQKQQHRPRSPGKRTPATRAQITQRVNSKLARTARMPNLPANDHRVIVRPRCGFAMGRLDLLEFVAAMATSACIPLEATLEDTVCPNFGQNIIVISTPSQDRAGKYDKVREITIQGNKHEIYAYRAAPDNTTKGIIYNIPLVYTQADIDACLLGERNPTVLAAHRMGETTAVIILFDGGRVPQYVKFASLIVRCKLYKQHKEVCRSCGQVGHRKDVCPRPDINVCFACGLHNPQEGHEATCKPVCKLCGGPHPSGTGKCRNKYKTPFVVRQRKMAAKKAGEHRSHDGKVSFMEKEDFPRLRREGKENNGGTPAGETRGRGGRDKSPLSHTSDRADNAEVKELRELVAQLQETVKEQKKMIEQLLRSQTSPATASQQPWRLGSVPRPPSLTPTGESGGGPLQPPAKMRKRTVVAETENEETMNEESVMEDNESNNGGNATDESRPAPDETGINYGVRIHKLGKRLDKQANQIKVLSEKMTSIEQNIASMKREFTDLKQFIMDQFANLGGKQHGGNQGINDGP